MQNSLDRLFDGMAASLRDVVLPALDDPFASAQVAACIELIGNLSARVRWRPEQLESTTIQARLAIETAVELCHPLAERLGPPPDIGDPLTERNSWLARVALAIRLCDEDGFDDAAREPLVQFSCWHLECELGLLKTGMYKR